MIKTASKHAVRSLQEFLKLEAAGGILLVGATVIALLAANIPIAQETYEWFLALQLTVTLGGQGIDKPLLLWINDALMVLFFMLVGLELKREVVEGQLSRLDQVLLPALAALGGLVVPAAIFWWINQDFVSEKNGWAIPTATDIAFALAVLGLMGSRVPVALKIFLTTIAIIDDIAAIVSSFDEVNHNYEREHRFNLWFVVVAEDQQHLQDVLAEIEENCGYPVLDLPLLNEHFIDLGFDLKWT